MDPFPDFGLFEFLAATGIAWLARQIYTRRFAGFAVQIVSIVAPLAVLILAGDEVVRWISAVCLATALINAGYIFPQLMHQKDDVAGAPADAHDA